jgi:hypothetical protein
MQDSTIANIISVFSLLVSIMTMIYSSYISKKINKTNLKSNIFYPLLSNLLLKKIPVTMKEILNNNFNSITVLENSLTKLYKNLSVYKYINKKFYSKVVISIEEVDDFIVQLKNNQSRYRDTNSIARELEAKIIKMYDIFMKEYYK